MPLHTKKIYYKQAGVVRRVDLYTQASDVGTDPIRLMDGTTPVYAATGPVTSQQASGHASQNQ